MRCPGCQTENRQGAKFCIECAAPLPRPCPGCGENNPSHAKFCSNCAAPLDESPKRVVPSPPPGPERPASHPSPPAEDGERRHLTVLFCDIVDSTDIAARLDAEQWHDIAAQYQRAAADQVRKFAGHVAKYLGDGLIAYFGYPTAQEDAAERGVRAGLAILDAMTALNAHLKERHDVRLQVRVGVHSGSVVVAQGGGDEADMFGEAPAMASRVQAVAEPDTVVMTEDAHDLVSGLFVVVDLGRHHLKGIERPVRLFRAMSAGLGSGRGRSFAARDPIAFVGRSDELHLLLGRWQQVSEGEGQVALVVGEPEIGKTRLVEEFRSHIRSHPHLWIECGGAAFFSNTPFHAVTQMLNQGLGWRGDESVEEKLDRLRQSLSRSGVKQDEAVQLIAEMLNIPVPGSEQRPVLAPDLKRKRLLAALAEWVFGASQPLVVVVEDLHWVDPSTLELLQTLVGQGATSPLMLLCTSRPEFRAPWPMRAHHTLITLSRLNNRETRQLVTNIVARVGLSRDVIDAVIARTDGVPLFAEELTRLVVDGDGRAGGGDIPSTLLDSLAARLDRLGRAKDVAQLGAVIGRDFSYELLRAVSPLTDDQLQSELARLADAELIFVRGLPPDANYKFKHALIQDAAYIALLKSKRRELHVRVAETIVEKFPELAQKQPEVLARHWSEAGSAENAIACWTQAASADNARHAFKEAEAEYRQALSMLETLPESPERDARALALGSAFHGVLHATRGFAAPETRAVAERNRALAEKSGDLGQLIRALTGSWTAAWGIGKYGDAASLADQLLDLATREGSDVSLSDAHYCQFAARYIRGDLEAADRHFVAGKAICDSKGYNGAFGIATLGMGLHCAWALGRSDLARRRATEAKDWCLGRQNPFEIAAAQFYESMLFALMADPERAERAASLAVSLSQRGGFRQAEAGSLGILGWARARLGNPDDGVAIMRDGINKLAEVGSRIFLTFLYSALAEAQSSGGGIAEALATAEEALAANPEELLFRPGASAPGRSALEIRPARPGRARHPRSDRSLADDERENLRAARNDGARTPARGARRGGFRARDAGAPLWPFRRGLRHRRSHGRQGSPRRARLGVLRSKSAILPRVGRVREEGGGVESSIAIYPAATRARNSFAIVAPCDSWRKWPASGSRSNVACA